MIKQILTICLIFSHLISFAQNDDAELLSQVTSIKLDKGKLIKNHYFEVKINNRAGEKYTNINIPYSRLSKVSKIDACIKDSKGKTIRKLKKNQITERSSISGFSFYEDDFIKEFTLKHNAYPYIVEYSYEVEESEFLFVDYWTPVLDRKIQTRNSVLTVSLPKDFAISYSNRNVNKPKIDSSESNIKYTWQTNYSEIVEPEVLSPPIDDYFPTVIIVPLNFNFETEGSFKSWSEYGDWQYKILEELNSLPESEKNKISKLIKGIDNEKEKIRTLYHYLQDETRYINITIETGGLKPYPAQYVAANKYGDCKALSNYFKSVLDFVGINSYYTKIYAGNPIKGINKTFPSQQFNHVILYVPLENDTVWLDCTSDGAFNYLGTFTQNRNAFVVDKDSSKFIRTPALKSSEVQESRKIKISYKSNQNSEVSFQNAYRGDMYEDLLVLQQSYSESDISRILRNYIVEDGFELINYKVFEKHRDSLIFKLSYETVSSNIYQQYGNDILVSNIPFSLPEFEKPELRKLPVQIDFPICKTDTLQYDLVPGYKLNKNLNNISFSNKYGSYSLKFFEENNSIRVKKNILINSGIYPVSEYKKFYGFYEKILELENKTFITLFK